MFLDTTLLNQPTSDIDSARSSIHQIANYAKELEPTKDIDGLFHPKAESSVESRLGKEREIAKPIKKSIDSKPTQDTKIVRKDVSQNRKAIENQDKTKMTNNEDKIF